MGYYFPQSDAKNDVLLAIQDTNQVKEWNQLADQFLQNKQYEQALNYANQAYQLADNLKYTKGKAKASEYLGRLYQLKKNYTTSLNYLLESATIYQASQENELLALLYAQIGNLYQEQSAFDKAINYFNLANKTYPIASPNAFQATNYQAIGAAMSTQKNYPEAEKSYLEALKYYKTANNLSAQAIIYNRLSYVSQLNQNIPQALEYENEAFKIYQKKSDGIAIANTINNIGFLHKQIGDEQKSLQSFRQALNFSRMLQSKDKELELRKRNAQYSNNLGVVNANLRNYREARKNYEEALKIYESQNDNQGIGTTYNYLAATYYIAGNNDNALKNAFLAIEYGKKIPSDEILQTAYKIISDVNQRNGDYKEAQLYYKLYMDLKENQSEAQRKKEQEILQNQIDIERKESELKSLQADKEKQALTLRQLQLEKERQEKDIALLRSNQEMQTMTLKNQELEKDRVQQLLQITKAKAEADRQKAEAERQKQENALLEQNKKLQDLALKQKAAQEKEKQKEIELLEKDKKMQDQKLKDEAAIRWYFTIFSVFAVLALLAILYFLFQSGKQRRALAKQNEEINQQKSQLENHKYELESVNKKLLSNEQILQKAYDKVKKSEVEIREKNEELQASEEELRQNMEELEANKEALEQAYKTIETKNIVFTHSIRAGEKIQNAFLPSDLDFKEQFADHFIIFRPKDVVSGDFYWLLRKEHKTFVACVDCTGHGVPGAFMSLIGHSLLNEIINEKHILQPNKILETLNIEVQKSLKQRETNGIEGMDMAICVFEKWENDIYSMQCSAAKNSIYYATEGNLLEIAGDRKGIGGWQDDSFREFTNHVVKLNKGDKIFLTTDGYIDAPNPQRKKLGVKKLKEIIADNLNTPFADFKAKLIYELDTHQADSLQRDDITFLGLKI